MNRLADSYIPDKLARLRLRLCATWTRRCIELRVADAVDDSFDAFAPPAWRRP